MCAAPEGGASLEGVDVASQSIIQGVVVRGEVPVTNAYVRLLDRHGEFTAEVATGDVGQFRFFAAPGEWRVRALAPRADVVERTVTAAQGAIAEVQIPV